MNLVKIETDNQELQAVNNLSPIVEEFINEQDVRESSKKLYRRQINLFFNWVTVNNLQVKDLSRADIIRYKESLLGQGMSSLTVGSYLTAIRKFYTWSESKKYYPNIAKGIKTPKRKKQFKKQSLTPEQGKDLLEFYRDKALRDYAIVNLLLRGGLRTIELVRANIEDITIKQGQRVLLVHGKGRDSKEDFIILSDKAYKPIEEYLDHRAKISKENALRSSLKAGEPLFTSSSNNSKGKRLTTRTVSQIAKEGLKAIGLDTREFTAHSLRHSTAVNILRAGGSLEDIQGVLRHTNPATTQIYLESVKEEQRLKNATEKLLDNIF